MISCNQPKQEDVIKSITLHSNWQFSQENSNQWYPAIVPGVVHLDLLANQLIEDPYWENNELKQRWIEEENWVYKTTFKADNNLLQNQYIELDFEGLDTYADVYLNDQRILSANNMFRSWNVEVKDQLVPGENELKIIFQSPIK